MSSVTTEISSPVEWRRVSNIMEALLGLEKPYRHAYLRAIGRDNPELEERVRSLLADLGQTTRVSATAPPSDLAAAQSVGPYELLEILGAGGMGTVFLARHKEEGFERRVAVKILHDRLGLSLTRQRFLVERQILATLDHPYIARLLDVGTTPDGRPFLVMQIRHWLRHGAVSGPSLFHAPCPGGN
ncbi:MAG: protein kinase [Acidobacteriota bacterium]